MYVDKTMFAQIMDFLTWKTFHRIVTRYQGDYRIRTLSCAKQFHILAFAQLTYRESSITWAFANRFRAQLWRMPMPIVIGASMPNLLND